MTAHQDHAAELLPWMAGQYGQLLNLEKTGKLAHAYLFGGQQGLGKLSLARHFAHYLLCQDKQGDQPCNQCRECHLLAVETHPDLKVIRPEESAEIKIDQIREAIDFISRTSQRGGHKIVIIAPAEAMNQNAANALLKVLEEPASHSLLLLISHQPALLTATIRSRCHLMKFSRPSAGEVIPWLESKNVRGSAAELLRLANNVPLKALHYADEDGVHDRAVLHGAMEKLLAGRTDISEAAAECAQFSIEDNIENMMLCASDILAHNQRKDSGGSDSLHDPDLNSLAEKFQDRTRMKALHDFYRELLAARRAITSTSNPNAALVLESLFYNWAAILR